MSCASSPALASVHLFAAADDRQDLALGDVGFVAEELGRADFFAQLEPQRVGRGLARADPAFARLRALPLHRGIEPGRLDLAAAPAQHVLGEVQGEAERVVEPERDLARERLRPMPSRASSSSTQAQAAPEHVLEAHFFELQRLGDERLGAHELGKCRAHLPHQRRHEAPQQRLLRAQDVRVPHGAAHDPAQHVAASFLRRQHAVGDEERGRAQMIGDDAVRDRVRPVGGDARRLGRGEDEGAQHVGVVIVVLALQHGGDALQSHAGVDRRARQIGARAVGALLELHEDEVPDLGEAVAIGIGAAGRPAGNALAVVPENLRARAARAGIAHRPEIVRGRDADDARVGEPRDLGPQFRRVLVRGMDGDPEPVLGEGELLRHEVPGELDRDILEIIAEREIAEHLEESVVPRGVADILEIVVLAAGAHAFLRRGGAAVGALLEAGEDVLELHHAGVGEEQRRVVARHERRGRQNLVAVPGEIGEERGADVVRQHGAYVVLDPTPEKARARFSPPSAPL